ncbi:MAG TPA: DUF3445 domain-containing protein [Acetobacteraceae bacterium]|nr:DUF3445 domain-containing protein [Acetobacteraceae bacterium]
MAEPPPPRSYLPFEAGPWRMAMGLVAAPVSALFEIDSNYREQMALRRRLLMERRGEVFAALPGSAPARHAMLALAAAHLPAHHPQWFARAGSRLINRLAGEEWDLAAAPCDPLELAGRLVQEDLCLIEPEPAGPCLTAAVLCFPTRWRLAEKLGHPLTEIHAPVPFFAERLAAPVDRFMTLLKPGKLVERFNWSILDDPALFQPGGHGRAAREPAIAEENAGEKLWLRVERQTLSRLPGVTTILFTIKIHQRAIGSIAAQPAIAARLASALRALPEETMRYKSLLPFRTSLLAYLDRRASA